MMRHLAWTCLVFVLLPGARFGVAGDPPPSVKLKPGARTFCGDPRNFKAPAEISAPAVFDRIKEYREIRSRGLTENDAEYWLLLEKANRRFYAALRKAAKSLGKDMVAEKGGFELSGGATVPEITADVTNAVDNDGEP